MKGDTEGKLSYMNYLKKKVYVVWGRQRVKVYLIGILTC